MRLLLRGGGPIAHAYRAVGLWKGSRWSPPRVSPVRYLDGTGALGSDMLAVHAVQVSGEDIAVLAGAGAVVAHCPRSNLKLRCGRAPVAEMLAAGAVVGLGTDSLASNDSLDMFAEMRAALAVSKERAAAAGALTEAGSTASTPTPLTAADVLRMATLDGARALGWERLVGSLEVGRRADIIAVRLGDGAAVPPPPPPAARRPPPPPPPPHARPQGPRITVDDPTETFVRSATADDVRMTMIDGRVVSEGDAPPPHVLAGLNAARERLSLPPI